MAWNGVPYSITAIQEGQYTYWSYAHLMYSSGFTGTAKTVVDQLVKQIHDVDMVQAGSLLKDMKVSRQGDGTPVTFGNNH